LQAKRTLDASFRVNCSAGDASSDRHHEEEHTDEVCDTEEAEFWALIHGIAVRRLKILWQLLDVA